MSESMKIWLHGLAAAAITGAATTGGGVLSAMAFAPKMVWNVEFWATVGGSAVFGAVFGAVLYLRKSPVPEGTSSKTTITVETKVSAPVEPPEVKASLPVDLLE